MGRKDWDDDDDFEDTSLRDEGLVTAQVHRVNGPPGCGKTTWLSRQANLAADKHGGSAVVVASLTRAAASEVAGRKTLVPRKNVGTLHSHAYWALGKPSIAETSDGLKSWNAFAPSSSMRISNRHAVDPENASPEPAMIDSTGAEMLGMMGVMRARMTPRELWSPRVARFTEKWDEWKKESGYWDFTDLIERAIDDVPKHPASPNVVLLDEAQDMSRLDMKLALQWGMAADTLVVVGDADQNLYQWRGSEPEAFVGLPADSIHTLAQSYRVPRAVHEAATSIVERIEGRERVEYHPRREDPENAASPYVEGSCERGRWAWRDPAKMAMELETQSEEQTVMVLASCGYMLSPLIAELRKRGIPFHNPYRTNHGAWNPLRGARRLLAFLRPQGRTWGDEARMWTWGDLKAWTYVLQSKGVLTRGTKSLIEAKCMSDKFGDGGTDKQPDMEEVAMLFEDYDPALRLDTTWWEKSLKHSERTRQQYPLAVARRHGAAVLLETPKLVIGTIHSVKGGESDRVYVFPDLSNVGGESYRKGGEGRDAVHRQFYVATTRARESLVLCRPSGPERIRW